MPYSKLFLSKAHIVWKSDTPLDKLEWCFNTYGIADTFITRISSESEKLKIFENLKQNLIFQCYEDHEVWKRYQKQFNGVMSKMKQYLNGFGVFVVKNETNRCVKIEVELSGEKVCLGKY